MRRSWLKKVVNVSKRYLLAAAAHNLGRIMRKLFGIGKPRTLQDLGDLAALTQLVTRLLDVLQAASRIPSRTARAKFSAAAA